MEREGFDRAAVAFDDTALMAALARGDGAVLAAFYERDGGIAFALARRGVRDDALASAIVIEAFEALWRRAGEYDPNRASPRAWLLSAVRARVRRAAAAAPEPSEASADGGAPSADSAPDGTVQPPSDGAGEPDAFDGASADAQPPANPGDPWPEAFKRRAGPALRAALASLPPERRAAVAACAYSGLSISEAASRVRTSRGTMKRRLGAAVSRIRARLSATAAREGFG